MGTVATLGANRIAGYSLRGAKARFHLILVFLFWSVLPHFSLYLHAHAKGGEGHTHPLLNKSQLDQAQTLAASAADAFGEASLDPSFGLSDGGRSLRAGACGQGPGIAPSQPAWHGHYQEEDNVLSTPLQPREAGIHPVPGHRPSHDPLPSACRLVHSVLARGPPSFPASPASPAA